MGRESAMKEAVKQMGDTFIDRFSSREKYESFFYGKNQSGGSNLNSYGLCVIGTALCAESYWQWLIATIVVGIIILLERNIIEKKRKSLEKFKK